MYSKRGYFGMYLSQYSRLLITLTILCAGGLLIYYSTSIQKNYATNSEIDANQIQNSIKNNIDQL